MPRPDARSGRTIRSATLLGYSEAAAAVGLDAAAMLQKVGLDATCMNDWDTKIGLDAFLALLAASAAEANCGDFGARAALARGLPDYGPVSLAMREAETVEAALGIYTKYLRLHCDDILVELDRRFESPFIKMNLPGNTPEEIAQVNQFGAVGITTQLRWLTGGEFQPKLVCYAFPRPPNAFRPMRFAECEIAYNQTVSGLLIERSLLSRPLVTSEPRLRRIAMQQLKPVLGDVPDHFVAKVYDVVRQLLPENRCSSEVVAARFRIDRRTLNRRLEREGKTFSSVVQQIRVEATLRALNGSLCPLTDIAGLVGFESLSSFSRWFLNSFGCNARDWRRGLRAGTKADCSEGPRDLGVHPRL